MVELLVVVALIGIVSVISVPFFLSFWQSSTLKAGAEELVTVLNGARQLAIRNNSSVCVKRNGNNMEYYTNSGCTGSPWTGPSTTSAGLIALTNNVQVSAAAGDIVFNYLGAATTAGNLTVRNPVNQATLVVCVAASGRIRIVASSCS